tara:strand:+ start:1842 stop:2699 length:858 start_codon:yes stop_codon:yes gene_type:complete
MSFFDKKQEVIDIRLTQFGKNLLARGFFKPVYYRFFDDDIIYNSNCAGIKEEQNRTEERILEAQRLKTQHLTLSVEEKFDQNQELINSGSVKTFMEISRRQDPLFTEAILKYPLENSKLNSNVAPRFELNLQGAKIDKVDDSINVDGVSLPVPQLQVTASYTLYRDSRNENPENQISPMLYDSENYIDLTRDRVDFLNKTSFYIDRQDLIIDLQEYGVDLGLDNFEIELFEIQEQDREDGTKKQILTRVESETKFKKILNIRTDSMVEKQSKRDKSGRATPRGRS